MAIVRGSIFVKRGKTALSDEQINAAALYWLHLLKFGKYSHDPRANQPAHRLFFAAENKKALIADLYKNQPTWEADFLKGIRDILTENRKEQFVELCTDYAAEDLLERAVAKSVPGLAEKYSIFPLKVHMLFDEEDNLIVNGEAIAADTILHPKQPMNSCWEKFFNVLGCPRAYPGLQKIGKLFGYGN